jgi:hypothetical protein
MERRWMFVLVTTSFLQLRCGTEEGVVGTRSALTSYGNCGTFNDDQVCICSAPNGAGTCAVLSLTTRFYANLGTVPNLPNFNDKVESMRLGATVKARLCYDQGWYGPCVNATAGQIYRDFSQTRGCPRPPDGGWDDVGWGNTCMHGSTTAIRLDPVSYNCFAPGAQQISIFQDINFGGDCVVLDPGSYADPIANPTSGFSGGGFGMRGDSISSYIDGANASINFYRDVNSSTTLDRRRGWA